MAEGAKLNRGVIAAFGALAVAGVFANAAHHSGLLLREADLWWHIKSGLTMFASHAVPQVDTFSYTHEGQPWIAKEWLAQVIYAASWLMAGWAGPLLVAALSIALASWLIYARATRDLQPFYAVALVIIGAFLTQGVTVARPHVLTFPIAVALSIALFDAARSQKTPPWWTLLLTVLWTNLHGSFAIAFLISGCAFLDYLERTRLQNISGALRWVAYLALTVAATLINPYFFQPYVIALQLAGGIGVMDRISEWAPFSAPGNSLMEGGFMLAFFLLLKARARLTLGQILFTLMCFHMMLSHMRFLYVFFLLVPVALLPEIVEGMPALSVQGWAQRPRDGLERLAGGYGRAISVLALLAVLVYGGWLAMKDHVVPPQNTSVAGAIDFVLQNRDSHPALQKKVFNDYNMGGPLILAGIKTYIDGRAEQLFLGDFMTQYIDSGEPTGRDALAKILSDQGIGWALFQPEDRRSKFLSEMPDWQKAYADETAVVWERKGP
ncbi:MAG: hypothetical protein KGO53_08420 [Alphaproteobacteria bacterium]|nr:hypothetical protein [Alphaproteobacteria bacterium]